MKEDNKKFNLKDFLDNILLINLFLAILSAIFFIFSILMQINGNSIFLNFFRKFWNPLILPIISILIFSTLVNAIISWLKRKVHLQEEDI